MSDYQKETEFLRRCLHFEDTAEHSDLEATITRLQLNERCVHRAIWLMALLTALALVGLGYSVIFQADQIENASQRATPMIDQVFCVLGLGSLICLVSFVALGLVNRRELNQRREQGRRLVAKLMDSRMGGPDCAPWKALRERDVLAGENGTIRIADQPSGSPT